ncbi:unnamed protein product [Heligmosomoides polygyrus]|uniref:Uncharacterized protein n=1 Tax=Heligmosomoides polygyrus TaxID=6339 RepID=A0A183FSL7_HELPZ|nr:unnamed protein product [Heligmosomoides polygyrus]
MTTGFAQLEGFFLQVQSTKRLNGETSHADFFFHDPNCRHRTTAPEATGSSSADKSSIQWQRLNKARLSIGTGAPECTRDRSAGVAFYRAGKHGDDDGDNVGDDEPAHSRRVGEETADRAILGGAAAALIHLVWARELKCRAPPEYSSAGHKAEMRIGPFTPELSPIRPDPAITIVG